METGMKKTMKVPEKKIKISSPITMRKHIEKYDCKVGTFYYQELEYILIHSFK